MAAITTAPDPRITMVILWIGSAAVRVNRRRIAECPDCGERFAGRPVYGSQIEVIQAAHKEMLKTCRQLE